MKQLKVQTLFEIVDRIEDPRVVGRTWHKLLDIIVIAVCASICGAEDWHDIAEFGKARLAWFAEKLELAHGIPSHDTFRRVFILLEAEELERVFLEWMSVSVKLSKGAIINIDGKTLRGSKHSSDGRGALQMVSAWAAGQSVVLGQVRCAEKSNEITAIPELLGVLELEGCIITIDAMGCQKEIVKQIVAQGGDYLISLKGNQGTLHQEIKGYLDWAERRKFTDIKFDSYETLEKGHGRIERRRCWITKEIEWLAQYAEWLGLQTVVMVEAEREVIGGEKTVERRYFISSLEANAKEALRCVRGHWAIENQLHWCLDIGFREDASRSRAGNSAENLAVVRHIGINLLKQEKSCQRGIKGKRLKAAWDNDYLSKVLRF